MFHFASNSDDQTIEKDYKFCKELYDLNVDRVGEEVLTQEGKLVKGSIVVSCSFSDMTFIKTGEFVSFVGIQLGRNTVSMNEFSVDNDTLNLIKPKE